MSIESRRQACLDEETLAAFAEGKLKRSEMPAVLEHLRGCPRCMSALEVANEFAGTGVRAGRPFRWWWLGAAAAVIAAVLAAVPLLRREASPVARLIQLAPASQRSVEARLSGGFAWAPYRGPDRANEEEANVQRFKLVGETASILERAEQTKSADDQHAAGLALLLIDRMDESIARLREAAAKSPGDARAWSDLAAAEYASALRHGRASLYPEALGHADRALRIDPRLAEALFNRALILERLGLTEQARAAWQRYLAVDGASRWADEARQHLQRLPARTSAALFKDEEPRLRAAEQRVVDGIARRFPQQARTYAEAEYLGRWGETGSEEELATARKIGDALARLSGESLLRDAVATIDEAPPPRRRTLAAAHALYRQARMAYARQRPAEAEPGLRRAAELFASASSPMALVARYFAANTRVDQNDIRGGRAELRALRDEASRHPRYMALAAQIEWELALCSMFEGDWEGVAEAAGTAADGFRRLGETSNLAFMQMMLADALVYVGRPDEGWKRWIEVFTRFSAEGAEERLQISVAESALVEQASGRSAPARAVLALAESGARTIGHDGLLSITLVREALLAAKGGEHEEALRSAREAMLVAGRIADPGLRARAMADADLAAGAVAAGSDPRLGIELLSRAIRHYEDTGIGHFLAEAKLLRSRAAAAAGDRNAALRDIDSALAQIEARRAPVSGPVTGTGVYDAATELYRDAIRLSLDRGDTAGAFLYAERSRGALAPGEAWRAIDVPELQRRLRGTGAAVLEVVSLGDEQAAFFITEDEIHVGRASARPPDDLYDRIIRPFEASLSRARQLIVVADPSLQGQSFAALYDPLRKRHLIEQLPVAMALSASSLEPELGSAEPRSVVAVALPSGGRSAALPESLGELRDIESLYPRATVIDGGDATVQALLREAPHASVVHIAGHTERDAAGDDALLFAASERVSWSTAASMAIGRPIVVLAACETLRVPQMPRVRALSVGGGFLAAGATAVVGTLTPVADNDARQIFRTVHSELAKGAPPVVAVQRAQREALMKQSPAWRSVTVLVTRISRL